MDLFSLLQNQMGFFLLMFARLTGIFSTAPVFGSRNVPVFAKAGLSLSISYLLLPVLYRPDAAVPEGTLAFIAAVMGEYALGLIFGYVSFMVFWAIQMAGQLLDLQIGFGIVNVFDPQIGQQIPLIGNFKYILAILLFLSTNGHHILLSALVSSFRLIPVTGAILRPPVAGFMVDLVAGTFIIALKISLPVVVALYLTDLGLGILARTLPQINVFVVGIPGKILVGLFVLIIALPVYTSFLEVAFNGMYSDLYRLLSVYR